MVLLEVPNQTSPALEALLTDPAGELGRVGLEATDKVILHSIHCGALKVTFLGRGGGGEGRGIGKGGREGEGGRRRGREGGTKRGKEGREGGREGGEEGERKGEGGREGG